MSEAKAPKKMGRPLKDPGAGRRATVTFRPPAPLHERMQAEARTADRSVSEEVERAVAECYQARDSIEERTRNVVDMARDIVFEVLYDRVAGKDNFNAGQGLAHALKVYQAEADAKFRSEAPWYEDTDKRKYVKDKAKEIIDPIIERLIYDLDPDAEERRRASWGDSALSRLASSAYSAFPTEGLAPLGGWSNERDDKND